MEASRRETAAVHSDVAGLVAQCVRGDDRAKASFYERYHPLVSKAVARELNRMGQSDVDSEDLVHEVFVHLFAKQCQALRTLYEPRSIDAWIMTVAQNRVRSYVRKLAARGQIDAVREAGEDVDPPPTPRAAAERNEQLVRLEEALQALAPRERLVLDFYYLRRMAYADIATVLNLNINTVASVLRRARIRLRKAYDERDHEEHSDARV